MNAAAVPVAPFFATAGAFRGPSASPNTWPISFAFTSKRVLDMHKEGLSYRLIGRNVELSKNTVMEIVRREGRPVRRSERASPMRVSPLSAVKRVA